MAGSDNTLYLYTSLTAGSSHIITATSRLETILKANKIPFQAIDIATDDAARRLWGRYSKGRKLPGLVKFRTIIGLSQKDLEQIEEWNEYGELKAEIGSVTDPNDFSSSAAIQKTAVESVAPKPVAAPTNTTTTAPSSENTSGMSTPHIQIQNPPVSEIKEDQRTLALRLAGEEAAAKAKDNARSKLGAKPPTTEAEGKALPTSNPKAKGTEPIPDTAGKSPAAAAATTSTSPTTSSNKQEDKREYSQSPAGRRSSVAPEIIPPLKRPSLADESAAVSTANFRAENAEALGLIGHHRGSIISATTEDEQEKVRKDIRASVSEAPADGDIQALRQSAAEKEKENTTIAEDEEEDEGAVEEEDDEKLGEKKEDKTTSLKSDDTQKQETKDESKAGVSVED
ncbi:hypothetical protein UA08_01820 [Talaromyces atroroseus]|uniref:Glutaredoxin domain-containing protein n=1 Tax=Talaromyces atroroseus TaxID=1441469 RepID=A0A1Q5QBV1_TALAT|nr:hypothetical protein UA08_01820 [Talaromyces atroroseus]OKL63415.1 hypothetical protein UA08_01820 [Talaromyces atroroseus]